MSSNSTCLSKEFPSEWAVVKGCEPGGVEGIERLVLHPAPVKAHLLLLLVALLLAQMLLTFSPSAEGNPDRQFGRVQLLIAAPIS